MIAALTVRDKRMHMEGTLDNNDAGANNIYKVDVLAGMIWVSRAWSELPSTVIKKLLGTQNTSCFEPERGGESRGNEMLSGLERQVAESVPARQRMSIQELVNPVAADDSSQSETDLDLV